MSKFKASKDKMHKRLPSHNSLAIQLSSRHNFAINGSLPNIISILSKRPQKIIKQIIQKSNKQNNNLSLTNKAKIKDPIKLFAIGSNSWW